MIELATHNSNLNTLLEELPDQILSPIQDAKLLKR